MLYFLVCLCLFLGFPVAGKLKVGNARSPSGEVIIRVGCKKFLWNLRNGYKKEKSRQNGAPRAWRTLPLSCVLSVKSAPFKKKLIIIGGEGKNYWGRKDRRKKKKKKKPHSRYGFLEQNRLMDRDQRRFLTG